MRGLGVQPGEVIADQYRIERELSSGGMGAVYVATQLGTSRQRALKLMHPDLVRDEDMRRRFTQEARIGARVASEHIVEVIDAGVDASTGIPWLAMELLEGRDLGAAAKAEGPMPASSVITILADVCHALSAAHRAHVVHRDIKPENIFLATSLRRGGERDVKVLDFGIAKVVAEWQSSTTTSVGTPLWMAPEQTAAGAAIGPWTDVWPLGLIAFYLLTGKPYWLSAADENASAVKLIREIAFDPLVPASERAASLGVAHMLPPGFDAWFARCVAREPSDRYGSADELAKAMEAWTSSPAAGVVAPAAATPAAATPAAATHAATPAAATHDAGHTHPLPTGPTATALMTSVPAPPPRRAGRWRIGIAIAVVLAAAGAAIAFTADATWWSDPKPTSSRDDDNDDDPIQDDDVKGRVGWTDLASIDELRIAMQRSPKSDSAATRFVDAMQPTVAGIYQELERAAMDDRLDYGTRYRALRAYLMAIDAKQLAHQQDFEWCTDRFSRIATQLPAVQGTGHPQGDAIVRSAVKAYLALVRDERFKPRPLNTELVTQTRSELTKTPVEDAFYAIYVMALDDRWIEADGGPALENRAFPPIVLANVFADDARALTALQSHSMMTKGKPLEIHGAYTSQGFREVYARIDETLPVAEPWVLPDVPAVTREQREDLIKQVWSDYRERYGQAWQDFFGDIEIVPIQSTEQRIHVLAQLTRPEWPYLRLLRLLEDHTQRLEPFLAAESIDAQFEPLVAVGIPTEGQPLVETPLLDYIELVTKLRQDLIELHDRQGDEADDAPLLAAALAEAKRFASEHEEFPEHLLLGPLY